ncbi:hypothetical protein C461_13073 [Halorubrum aidingense JCM 13560]|uniref:N-acetyltransferase domain-containing protein n=1 Tax=Halorubrum aidingense JCM 13560 TaxID=1230454 RepID=M0PBB4_9EURY|nr:hypothetical protein [Halorubrum aidingense]EMA66105.1 hypothetical protein C461_13073 [Halorubrum aidingense JCM 13560]
MRVRDALESDAETVAAAIDRPREAVIDMIHDRSVRVAVSADETDGREADHEGDAASGSDHEGDAASEGETGSSVAGFVAFDVHGQTVHVTEFDGDEPTLRRLFEEPRRFADREGLSVEVVVPDSDPASEIVEAIGFVPAGPGPRFDGRTTTRYRIES